MKKLIPIIVICILLLVISHFFKTAETPDDQISLPTSTSEVNDIQTESLSDSEISATKISSIPEQSFKDMCTEVIYNDLDDRWIGKYVTKEILFTSSENSEYKCASTESYVEELSGYQRSYAVYDIFDNRFDKSFPIYSGDVIRIYGIVTEVKMNYGTGLNYPIIDMYYADYIREWKHDEDPTKSIQELIEERNTEKEQREAENQYYNSLNSDYTGRTKNIDNMQDLLEEDFKEKCDSMNFNDMVNSVEDLTGRYVKIHVQLTNHMVFRFEEGKKKHLGDLADIYDIDDNIWYSKQFYERTNEYIGDLIWLYFVDNGTYNLDSLKKEQELTVYGMVLDYKINDGFHNQFDFLVFYIE
jgi:hypothetical protein